MTQLDFGLPAGPPPRFPTGTIVRSAEVEDNYRWTMRRAWGPGRCIHWNLLNPSDADAMRDDPTTLRMIGFSYRWGFGSMVVTNVYPFMSATAAALLHWRRQWTGSAWYEIVEAAAVGWEADKSALNAWLHNMDVVRKVVLETDVHVAAWGNGPDEADVKNFLDEITWSYDVVGPINYRIRQDDCGGVRLPIEWHCIGRTLGGAPIHPLARGRSRVPDDAMLQLWRKA